MNCFSEKIFSNQIVFGYSVKNGPKLLRVKNSSNNFNSNLNKLIFILLSEKSNPSV